MRNIPVPRTRSQKCLKYREPLRNLCFAICVIAGIAIIYVNVTKVFKTCYERTPYMLCLANRHCAVMKKNVDNSYMDIIPFMRGATAAKCVARVDQPEYFYQAAEISVDWINSFTSKVIPDESDKDNNDGKEIVIPPIPKNKLLSEFKYEYDQQIGLGMTRYEIGIWIIFFIFYFLRKYLLTCGNKKTSFDFMRPSKNQIMKSDNKLYEVKADDIRRIRQQMLTKQNSDPQS